MEEERRIYESRGVTPGFTTLISQMEQACTAERFIATHHRAGLPASIVNKEGAATIHPGETQTRGLNRIIWSRYMDLCRLGFRAEASSVLHAHKETSRLDRERAGTTVRFKL